MAVGMCRGVLADFKEKRTGVKIVDSLWILCGVDLDFMMILGIFC